MRDALLEAGRASLVVVTFGRPPVTGSVAENRTAPDSLAYAARDTPEPPGVEKDFRDLERPRRHWISQDDMAPGTRYRDTRPQSAVLLPVPS
jgi:hypothetical protein